MLSIFFGFCLNICDISINVTDDALHYQKNINTGQEICINSTIYPFYIAFYSPTEDITLTEYRHASTNKSIVHKKEFTGSSIQLMHFYQHPFAEITIKSRVEMVLNFSLIPTLGICTNGIYISSNSTEYIEMSPNGQGFQRLEAHQDKCFVFITPASQEINAFLETKSSSLTIYEHGSNVFMQIGSFTYQRILGSAIAPPIIQLTTNDVSKSDSFILKFQTKMENKNPKSNYSYPLLPAINCRKAPDWSKRPVFITFTTLASFLSILCVVTTVYNIKHEMYRKNQ